MLAGLSRRPYEPIDELISDIAVKPHGSTGVIHAQSDGLTTVALEGGSAVAVTDETHVSSVFVDFIACEKQSR